MQGEGSGMLPVMYALAFKEVFIDFAQAFPCTARSAPSAGRAAHHLTAYEAQHGYAEVRDSLNEPEYSMNEEGDGPSNRTKSLARHPTSYEAQCEFAIVLDRLNEPEYSMNEEGDGPRPPGIARSDCGEDTQDEEWQQPQRSSEDGSSSSDSSNTSSRNGSGSNRGSDASDSESSSGKGSIARRAGQWPPQAPPKANCLLTGAEAAGRAKQNRPGAP
jgi:hypothetical protein